MRIIVFGLGKYYENRREKLLSYIQVDIVAYTDNNEHFWGGTVDGVPIVSPWDAACISCDAFLIMSTYAKEIYDQLTSMGVEDSKVIWWEYFCAKMASGTRSVLQGKDIGADSKGNVLIISTSMDYNGGSLAAVYAALAIKERGYSVVLAVPQCNNELAQEVNEKGITIYVCPALPYIFDDEKEWLMQFDVVVVNVFQMIQSVRSISSIRPVLWWIHEPIEVFEWVFSDIWNRVSEKDFSNVCIYAVSRIPKENFNHFYPGRIQKILHYGIPDMGRDCHTCEEKRTKVVFAIIGSICEIKAQDIFCEAAGKLNGNEKAQFWIIGSCYEDDYGKDICIKADNNKSIRMLGLLTREEINKVFPEIDVVVCASRADSLPIVVTEGMMFGKACIVTDATGTADYIQDGVNGFVVSAEDADALAGRMEWILDNTNKLPEIGMNARKTYEKYFTMEVFDENLEKVLLETRKEWNLRKERE